MVMKAKCTKVELASDNSEIVVLSFVRADENTNNPLLAIIQQSAANGECNTYYLPLLLKESGKSLEELKTAFEGQFVDGVNLYDFAADVVLDDKTITGVKVVNSAENLQPITIFRRAWMGSKQDCLDRLRTSVKRQIAKQDLEIIRESE